MLGRTLNSLAWAAQQRGDAAGEERLLRDAIRLLKPLEDRGALCESQRALAEVLIRKGRLDEAERLALEATTTVGEHDLSSRATTTMTLGLVRAAQGRDAEAEALLHEALDLVESTGFRGLEVWIIGRLEEFLRERGRDDEAAAYRERLAEISPVVGLAAAFAGRIERIIYVRSALGARRRPGAEDRADRLRRGLVRRLGDHGRGPVEAGERLGQRLGPERPLPVGKVLRLVSVRVLDVAEVDVERRARLEDRVGGGEHLGERLGVGEGAVRDRVEVREVEHRPDPGELGGDREHVLGAAEVADASHHLDAERHGAALAFESLAQLAELLDDRGQRLLACPAEQEAGVEDDRRGAAGRGDARRVVEHPDRHPVLLVALDLAEEAGERGVHRERDAGLSRELSEALGPGVLHPEAALEVDLAGAVAALQEELDGGLGALPGRHAGRPEPISPARAPNRYTHAPLGSRHRRLLAAASV